MESKFEYSVNGTRLNVIHRPADDSLRPTLILVNGGGWQVEDEDDVAWYAEGWAAHGYTVVSIAHRPVSEVSFPAPAQDILGGVEFALRLGANYDVDPQRLAFLGGSSGAHLATYTAYRLHETHPEVTVRAVVSIFGPTDLRYIADDHRGERWYRIATLVYTPELDVTSDVNDLLGCNILRRDCRDPIVQASPITYVDSSTPPTLILQGKADETTPWRQVVRLAAALETAGVEHELILDPDMTHVLDHDYLTPITEFLDAHLGVE